MFSIYKILESKNNLSFDGSSKDYQTDLNRKHINLQVNKKFWLDTKGQGDIRNREYSFSYIYEITKAFSAGSSRFLEYQFQYSGSAIFNCVVFDVIGECGLLYRIYEMPKFGKEKRFRLHVPFDSDVDPRGLRIVVKEITKARRNSQKV